MGAAPYRAARPVGASPPPAPNESLRKARRRGVAVMLVGLLFFIFIQLFINQVFDKNARRSNLIALVVILLYGYVYVCVLYTQRNPELREWQSWPWVALGAPFVMLMRASYKARLVAVAAMLTFACFILSAIFAENLVAIPILIFFTTNLMLITLNGLVEFSTHYSLEPVDPAEDSLDATWRDWLIAPWQGPASVAQKINTYMRERERHRCERLDELASKALAHQRV